MSRTPTKDLHHAELRQVRMPIAGDMWKALHRHDPDAHVTDRALVVSVSDGIVTYRIARLGRIELGPVLTLPVIRFLSRFEPV